MKSVLCGLLLAAATAPALAAADSPATYIQAGRLLADPGTGRVETAKTIVVKDGRIAEIRDGYVGEGKVVDLRDAFVMPGFIDSHVHITGESNPNERSEALSKSATDSAFDGCLLYTSPSPRDRG